MRYACWVSRATRPATLPGYPAADFLPCLIEAKRVGGTATKMSADDAVYATAMLMFATLPILSMRKPKLQHLTPDASSYASPEPARLVAAAAFVLLLWLQVRKEYLLGVAMIAINLVLRLYELARHACRVTCTARAMLCCSRATPRPRRACGVHGPASDVRSCLRRTGQLSQVRTMHTDLWHHQATTTSVRSSGGGRHSRARPGGRAAGRRSCSSAFSASPAPAPWPSRVASSGEPRRRSGAVCKASRRSCLRPCFTLPCC